LIPNALYSLILVRKNDSWRLFGSRPIDGSWPVLMAILWMGAFALYGMSSVYIGALGTSVGWALFQIFMILAATLSGVLTGEWKRASRAARALLYGGIAFLIGATVLLAFGSR
jgi:L-rhamnose-H+ transport protein